MRMITNKILRAEVNKKGGRLTKQRINILKYLQNVTCHPAAKAIYKNISKKMPRISLGTVHRNLKYLAENNFILQLNTSDNEVHFDGNLKYHFHFICRKCKKIYDIWNAKNILIKKSKYPMKIEKTECNLYGICNKCKSI